MNIITKENFNSFPDSLFNNPKYIFYAIYFHGNQYTILQTFKVKEKFQWFFIGKPFIFDYEFKTIKQAINFIIQDKNCKYVIYLSSDNYSQLGNLLLQLDYFKLNKTY